MFLDVLSLSSKCPKSSSIFWWNLRDLSVGEKRGGGGGRKEAKKRGEEGEKRKVLHSSFVQKLIIMLPGSRELSTLWQENVITKKLASSFSYHICPTNVFNAGKHKQAHICSVLSNSAVQSKKEQKIIESEVT